MGRDRGVAGILPEDRLACQLFHNCRARYGTSGVLGSGAAIYEIVKRQYEAMKAKA